jgi:hypothetical protein
MEVDGHILYTCNIRRVYVRASHWSGKTFCAKPPPGSRGGHEESDIGAKPYLTFLGSKSFGIVLQGGTVPN